MDFDLEEALTRFPLPEGVEDGVLNLKELAQALDCSEPTITRYKDSGMPVQSEGRNGRGYEFQLSHCFAWKLARDHEERADRKRRQASVDQMRLAFHGMDLEEGEERLLSPKEIAEQSEAEVKRLKAAQMRGDLTSTAKVQSVFQHAVVEFRNSLVTLPDFAEAEFSLPPEQVAKLQIRLDGILEKLEENLAEAFAAGATVATLNTMRGGHA